jgi:WD40 repeat protein
VRTVVASADHLYAVAVSDDGRAIATGGADRRVQIWDAQTGECLDAGEDAPYGGHGAPVLALAAIPGAAAWVSGSGDSTIRLWVDPRSPQPHRWGSRGEVMVGAVNCPWAVAVSPDGQWLATGNADAPVRLWQLPERRYLGAVEIPADRALAVVFGRSRDRTLILGSDRGQIARVPLPPSPCQWAIATDRGRITAIAFTPASRNQPVDHATAHTAHPMGLLTGGTGSPHLDAWDAQTGQHLGTHPQADHTLVLRSDQSGQYLARGSDTGQIQVWSWAQLWPSVTTSGAAPVAPQWQHRSAASWVSAIAFLTDSSAFADSPDLVWATLNGDVTRANVQTGVYEMLGNMAAGVRSLAVVDEWLWLGGTDGHLAAWHLTTGARSPLPDPHAQDVLAIGVPQCPDQPVITVGREGTVVARSRRSGRAIGTSLMSGGEVRVAAGSGYPVALGFAWPGRIRLLGQSPDSWRYS